LRPSAAPALEGRVEGQRKPGGQPSSQPRHGGHGWMMIACCIPMLIIAVILVATGAASPSLLVVALRLNAAYRKLIKLRV
jgi:hypothetical protein